MNIIIPLGGKGERFKNDGYIEPKPLIKVLEKEILFHVIDNLFLNKNILELDINIYIIYNKELDEYNFSEIMKLKYPMIYLIKLDNDTRGAAETVYIGINEILNQNKNKNKNNIYKKTLLIDGDTFYTRNIIDIFYKDSEYYDNIDNNNIDNNNIDEYGTIFYTKNNNPNPIFSYISFNTNNKVTQIIEKVKISDNANTGAYGFANIHELHNYAKYVLDNNITFKNEFYTSCIIDCMIKDGHCFRAIELNDTDVHVLGTPSQVRAFIENI